MEVGSGQRHLDAWSETTTLYRAFILGVGGCGKEGWTVTLSVTLSLSVSKTTDSERVGRDSVQFVTTWKTVMCTQRTPFLFYFFNSFLQWQFQTAGIAIEGRLKDSLGSTHMCLPPLWSVG